MGLRLRLPLVLPLGLPLLVAVGSSSDLEAPSYRNILCPNCGRRRVETDGICEKCDWDVDGGDYLAVTRPDEYDRRHHPSADHWGET